MLSGTLNLSITNYLTGVTHNVVECACSVQIFIGYIIKQFEFIEQGQMR